MKFWCILDQLGHLVMESNRKVPRLYATRQRAEEKIKMLGTADRWRVWPVRLVIE